ncbi:MAG: type II secretion system protein [Planctomycetaceae bacterium]
MAASSNNGVCPHRSRRCAFTLFESLVAVSITTIAGCAVLTSLSAAVRSSTEAAQFNVAQGMARQLINEVAAAEFPHGDSTAVTSRIRRDFETIDDFANWVATPPVDCDGWPLGTKSNLLSGVLRRRPMPLLADSRFIDNFTRRLTVERVVLDPNRTWRVVSEDSAHRRVTVEVTYSDQQTQNRRLCKISRIFSYVPTSP